MTDVDQSMIAAGSKALIGWFHILAPGLLMPYFSSL